MKALLSAAVVALSATACSYAIKTAADYDRTANFASYDTFFLIKGNSSGSPLHDRRAADDVHRALTSRGWVEVPAGEGRAAVVVHAASKTRHSSETFYDGWGGWRWRWGPTDSATTLVQDYKVGTVVVDIFDADTKQAIWHGSATDAIPDNGRDNAKATEHAIRKMFSKFPAGELTQ